MLKELRDLTIRVTVGEEQYEVSRIRLAELASFEDTFNVSAPEVLSRMKLGDLARLAHTCLQRRGVTVGKLEEFLEAVEELEVDLGDAPAEGDAGKEPPAGT